MFFAQVNPGKFQDLEINFPQNLFGYSWTKLNNLHVKKINQAKLLIFRPQNGVKSREL
jgi:hypothetical protein